MPVETTRFWETPLWMSATHEYALATVPGNVPAAGPELVKCAVSQSENILRPTALTHSILWRVLQSDDNLSPQ
jgi:hypothetical protein